MSTGVSSERGQLEDIFKEHGRFMYRTAYGVIGRHEDAEDIVQSIFLRLMRQQPPPNLGENPEGYLYRAAVNMALDTIKSRRREVLVDDDRHFEGPAVTESFNAELHRRLYQAIAKLKPDAAHIIILRYMHEKSDAQIARMLGVSRGTIALKLFRSRARLKKLLSASLGEL